MKTRYYVDLHIHSCLSPCADNDNTPNNLAGMAVLSGIGIMALTDHNTCKNCPAFFAAAKKQGIVPIAGMELTTAEDIHMICLFPTLKSAMEFDGAVEKRRILIENRPDIFGEQLILDENDEVTGEEPYLLSNATDITLEESFALAKAHGGICYPAHIDRQANGIIATLGAIPKELPITCVELHDGKNQAAYSEHILPKWRTTVGSDAHYLWDIRDKEFFVELDDTPYSGQLVRERLLAFLSGKD